MNAFMHESEIALIEEYLSDSTDMLEWGSGASTSYFGKQVKKLTSIEHHKKWYKRVLFEIGDNVNLIYVPANQIVNGTIPDSQYSDITDEKFEELKTNYPHITDHNIRRYWQFRDYVDIIQTMGNFNIVLVDGRARGMCAERARHHLYSDGVIFIHDFWNRYSEYTDSIFDVFEEVGRADRLVALRSK